MRVTTPVRLRGGDQHPPEAIAPYIGLARTILGQLKQRMQLLGLQQLSWQKHLGDGTFLAVRSEFGRDTVTIIPVAASAVAPIILSGFLCTPASDSETLEPYRVFGDAEAWNAAELPEAEYGNVDWQGPQGLVLSWQGDSTRYANAVGGPHIYFRGRILASLPDFAYTGAGTPQIAGAAIAMLNGSRQLVCCVKPGTPAQNPIYFFRRPFIESGYSNNDLFDPVTNPSGWVHLGTLPFVDSATRQGNHFWFFNQSGTEAQSAGRRLDDDDNVYSLRVKATISWDTVHFETIDHGRIRGHLTEETSGSSSTAWSKASETFSYSVVAFGFSNISGTAGSFEQAKSIVDTHVAAAIAHLESPVEDGPYMDVCITDPSGNFAGAQLKTHRVEFTSSEDEEGAPAYSGSGVPNQGHRWRDIHTVYRIWESREIWPEFGDCWYDAHESAIGPDIETSGGTITATITRHDRLRRDSFSSGTTSSQTTYSGEFLHAVDYIGDQEVLGIARPEPGSTKTRFLSTSSHNVHIQDAHYYLPAGFPPGAISMPLVHHPELSSSTSEETRSANVEVRLNDEVTTYRRTGGVQSTHEYSAFVFLDLRHGVYVMDQRIFTSGGGWPEVDGDKTSLFLTDQERHLLFKPGTNHSWIHLDGRVGDLPTNTTFMFGAASTLLQPVSISFSVVYHEENEHGNIVNVVRNETSGAVDFAGNVFFSMRAQDVYTANEITTYIYLTGGNPVALTGITGNDPRFHPIGLF